MNGVHAHTTSDEDVFVDVINEEDTFRRGIGGNHCGEEDGAAGLGCSDGAGINARGEMTHESEMGFEMLDVKRIGVGEGYEAAALGQLSEKGIGQQEIRLGNDDAVPCVAEFLEGDADVKTRGEVFVPLFGSEAAFLPGGPKRIFLDGGPHFFGGEIGGNGRRVGALRSALSKWD